MLYNAVRLLLVIFPYLSDLDSAPVDLLVNYRCPLVQLVFCPTHLRILLTPSDFSAAISSNSSRRLES